MSENARQILIKSKLYKAFGLIFAAVGLLVFIAVYMQSFNGDIFLAAREPAVFLLVLVPFLPACVLSYMASSLEKKGLSKLEKEKQTA